MSESVSARCAFLSVIDEKKDFLDGVADSLWETPELAFAEHRSAATLIAALKQEGFRVEENLAGIPTAFSGTFGSGSPVIGILGEFDALSGLGQESGALCQKPDGKENGQGCGHNLLGTASLGAAMAVKRFLETSGAPGTVIYYGCPGEEGGSGKAFMARDGVFDCLDAALCWHPDSVTDVRNNSSLANYQVLYCFDGRAAHAAEAPDEGRSALDAVELMNVGANFLREHMLPSARLHYAITDAGGRSPNVVQPHSEVLYLIRSPRNDQVKALYERVNDIAKGAALMTGTTESHIFIKACSNLVQNDTMQRDLYRIMQEITPPEPSAESLAYAKELTEKTMMGVKNSDPEHPIHWELAPYQEAEGLEFGSTDVGDVSWVCPTAQIHTATWAAGTPGHSWQVVAQGKLPLAHEMTRYAAKVLGAEAVELLTNPELLQKAKEEHRKKVGPEGYQPPIPKDVRPKALTAL